MIEDSVCLVSEIYVWTKIVSVNPALVKEVEPAGCDRYQFLINSFYALNIFKNIHSLPAHGSSISRFPGFFR